MTCPCVSCKNIRRRDVNFTDTSTDTTNPKDRIGSKKVDLSLVPPVADILESQVMQLGADKYGAFNWRDTSVRLTVYIAAVLRHMSAIRDGQDIDPESGISHWAHIRANTGIILDAMESGKLIDDRKTSGKAADVLQRLNKI